MASSSVIPPKEKYDVFLSFRGKDTRKNFTSHLHAALIRRKVETYIDYRLERGDEVGPALLKAIKESKISVIIFSENYADSSWCLDELAYVLKCKERHGQHVIPIFYETDPSDVRHQTGSYETALAQHEQWLTDKTDKMDKWKEALKKAANLAGFDSKTVRDDYDLVEQVVRDVLAKLNRESSMDLTNLIGAESRIQNILLELDIIPDDVRVRCVVLWGMGGIGKTTLAGAVFHGLSSQFDAHYFLQNVRERSGTKGAFSPELCVLRNELLRRLLKDEKIDIQTPTIDNHVKLRLRRTRGLVVLDDVNHSSQLTYLVGEVPFGPGSRIIITTRDTQPVEETLLVENESDHDVKICTVEELNGVESLKLLHSKAPKNLTENSNFSEKVVNYAAGIPLALKGLLALCRRYKTNEKLELLWDQLKKVSDHRLQKVYRVSYDGLTPNEQEIFLDIACFHKSRKLCDAERILDACGLFPNDGIKTLIDMSLMSIKEGCIWMHDVIQEMAREIVCEESPQKPGKRSRLHNVEDVRRVLKGNKGTARVQSISYGVYFYNRITWDPQAFTRMDSLRFLKLDSIKDDGIANLEYLPDALRYLYWSWYPLQSLPSKFSPDNLVELHMPNSNLKRLWGNSQNPRKLKRIDLHESKHLVDFPDLSESVSIEWISLEGCESLVQVPSYVQKCTKLTHLNLNNCSKLSILPDLPGNLEFLDLCGTAIEELPPSVWSLEKLRHLKLCLCSSIKNFPSSPWKLKSLNHLDLTRTQIERVPLSSFLCTTGIISLKLSGCHRLVSLPNDICELKSLQTLDLSGCSSFINFPEIAEPMEQLYYLDLTGTEIEELPSNFGNLVALKELRLGFCYRLKVLPSSFGKLVGLKKLDLCRCTSLESLPNSFCNLKVIEELSLCKCVKLKELPPSFTSSFLKNLDLSGCKLLEEIPDCSTSFPALEKLDLSETMIKKIPPSIKQVSGLKSLKVMRCKWLRSLPVLPCVLEKLYATECTRLETVANSVTADTQGLDQMLLSKYHMYNFGGCVNLNISSRIHIMDDALRMVTAFSRSMDLQRQLYHYVSNVKVTCPGDEIPKWFTIRKEGYSLNVELPQHWCNGNFLAIALCSVSAIPISVKSLIICEMILKTNNGETTHRHPFSGQCISFCDESVETDHVDVNGKVHEIPDKAKGSVEASFHFYTKTPFFALDNVKRCGVCFLNAQPQAQDESRLLCTSTTLHQQLADDVAAPGPRIEADDGRRGL